MFELRFLELDNFLSKIGFLGLHDFRI